MSFSFAVSGGDIVVKGSNLGIVHGMDKLKQDVSLWLRERYRSDRFHVNYGSTLDDYIGSVIDTDTPARVQAEVMRVLQNYQAVQHRRIQETPEKFSADEVLLAVNDIKTRVHYDTVIVNVNFTTGSGRRGQVIAGIAA